MKTIGKIFLLCSVGITTAHNMAFADVASIDDLENLFGASNQYKTYSMWNSYGYEEFRNEGNCRWTDKDNSFGVSFMNDTGVDAPDQDQELQYDGLLVYNNPLEPLNPQYFFCNRAGVSGNCPEGVRVATVYDAYEAAYDKRYTNGYLGYCVKASTPLLSVFGNPEDFDRWENLRDLPLCNRHAFLNELKSSENVTKYLSTDSNPKKLSKVYSGAPSDICYTYGCKEGYRLNTDPKNPTTTNVKCVGVNEQCRNLAEDQGYSYPGDIYESMQCTANTYTDDKNTWLGRNYLRRVRNHIDIQINDYLYDEDGNLLTDNLNKFRAVVASDQEPDFECDEEGCWLKADFFSDETKCNFACPDIGTYKVALERYGCPEYFNLQAMKIDEDDAPEKYEFRCVFSIDGLEEDYDDMRTKQQKEIKAKQDACQNALCEATGGTMNKSGACMCGEDKCIAEYPSNGNTYYYCGLELDDYGKKIYCNPAEDGYWETTTDEIKNAVSNMKATFKELCPTSNAMSDAGGPQTDIPTLVANLSKIESEFGLSKWRTAEGKFNYARLASDATAGIVLGTTGALVTAHVVKKKQVEDGFESLECTVGGQHVGDWGDVFRIDGK